MRKLLYISASTVLSFAIIYFFSGKIVDETTIILSIICGFVVGSDFANGYNPKNSDEMQEFLDDANIAMNGTPAERAMYHQMKRNNKGK